jgi:hypothetical protein
MLVLLGCDHSQGVLYHVVLAGSESIEDLSGGAAADPQLPSHRTGLALTAAGSADHAGDADDQRIEDLSGGAAADPQLPSHRTGLALIAAGSADRRGLAWAASI